MPPEEAPTQSPGEPQGGLPVDVRPWPARKARWYKGLVVSALIGAFVGVLLGYLSMLPFFLGLFFFLLLGLIPGAVLFRFGDPIRPVPRASVWGGWLLLIGTIFLVSLYTEYLTLPGHVAVQVRKEITGGFPKGYRREALNAHVYDYVDAYLAERYGSSGPIAYLRWAATSGKVTFPAGTIELPRTRPDSNASPVKLLLANAATYRLPQPALLWCIRVAFSFVLLAFALALQIVPLGKPAPEMLSSEEEESGDGTGDAT